VSQVLAYITVHYRLLCFLYTLLHVFSITSGVRTVPALGYWVLGNISRYWVVLLLGDIFFVVTPNTIPIRQQLALSTW